MLSYVKDGLHSVFFSCNHIYKTD
uniref:Uncharacterized protein n=1 Tax=Anguilla anguilla TaxID=7936 RepID=A0A0E9XAJ6_ANGAN